MTLGGSSGSSQTGSPREGPKRRRKRVERLAEMSCEDAPASSMEEEKLLRQAILNSKMSQYRTDVADIPLAPIFRPTESEFKDPIKYIRSIHAKGVACGIVRIVPPASWKPGFHINPDTYRFATRQQHVHKLQEAKGFDEGRNYSLSEYKAMADEFKRAQLAKNTHLQSITDIERSYWQIVTTGRPEVVVEYGNDVDSARVGSGFRQGGSGDAAGNTGSGAGGWNLNKIAILRGSPLRQLNMSVKGVTVPWVYCGMMYSSFCWHCEDNHLPSINFLHKGSPKVWYGVAPGESAALERVMKANMPLLFHREPDLMQKLVTMLDPATLMAHGVRVYKAVQEEGSFVVTFPRGYHCGFNTGYNVAEAVNFAYDEWFPFGRTCVRRYRELGRQSVFPHEWLLLSYLRQVGIHRASPVLKKEFDLMWEQQARLRRRARKAGIVRRVLMADTKVDSDLADMPTDLHACRKCRHQCYLSYVTCPHTTEVVCLNHLKYLCSCSPHQKVMHIRAKDGLRLGQASLPSPCARPASPLASHPLMATRPLAVGFNHVTRG